MKTKPSWDEQELDPIASFVMLNPMAKLGCAVILQAIRDLNQNNKPLRALDGLLWLLEDGYFYADALDIFIPPGQMLNSACHYREVHYAGRN